MRIIITIFLFSCLTASAQVFKAGLIMGISGAQIEGDGYAGYHKLGFIAGGFVKTNLSEKIAAQFEIYFINKGSFDAAHPDKGDFDSFSVNLNYIEIPIILNYTYKKIIFEAGLYTAKLIGTPKLTDENGALFVNRFPFKDVDLGGLIGFSYQLNEGFLLNLRSKNSLIPIRDFPNQDQGGIFNTFLKNGWYNVDLNFTIRYQF